MVALFARAPELFAGSPLLRAPLLRQDTSAAVVDTVLDCARFWQQRSEGDFYTFGAASYLDGSWDAKPYRDLSRRCNPVLAERFESLYQSLTATLTGLIGPVAFEPDLALPGFHVFCPKPGLGLHHASKVMAAAGGSIHLDLQHLCHATFWSRYDTVDWQRPLSFTLALELPAAGGGLRFWPGCANQAAAHASSAQMINYQVGEMVLFIVPLLHQIAPVPSLIASDRRITLQGHGLRCDGVWRLYF